MNVKFCAVLLTTEIPDYYRRAFWVVTCHQLAVKKMAERWFEPGHVVICGVRLYFMFGEHKTEINWWCTENEASDNC